MKKKDKKKRTIHFQYNSWTCRLLNFKINKTLSRGFACITGEKRENFQLDHLIMSKEKINDIR